MKTFYLILKWLLVIFLTANILVWLLMHGTSHIIPMETEGKFALATLVLCTLLWIVIQQKRKY